MGVGIRGFTCLRTALLFRRSPTAGTSSRFTLHYSLFTQLTPFGDSIFRCTAKDRGERRASSSQAPHPSFCLSGQKLSRSAAPPLPTKPTSLGSGGAPVGGPLESPGGNVLEEAGRTVCLPPRNGACDAITSPAVPRSKYPWGALRLSPCLCVLRVPSKNERFTQPPNLRPHTTPVIL